MVCTKFQAIDLYSKVFVSYKASLAKGKETSNPKVDKEEDGLLVREGVGINVEVLVAVALALAVILAEEVDINVWVALKVA